MGQINSLSLGVFLHVCYSAGLGQVLAVPGVIASSITAGVFGAIELGYHCKAKTCSDSNKKHILIGKKVSAKNRAIKSAAATAFFALGAIPLVGGLLGGFTASSITNLQKRPH